MRERFLLEQVLADMRVYIPLAGVIDIDKEILRHDKKIEKLQKRISSAEKKLSNPKFIDKAPEEIIKRETDALSEMKANQDEIMRQINSLKG